MLMGTVIKEITDEADFKILMWLNVSLMIKVCALFFHEHLFLIHQQNVGTKSYKHLGLYAYRKDFLMKYKELA